MFSVDYLKGLYNYSMYFHVALPWIEELQHYHLSAVWTLPSSRAEAKEKLGCEWIYTRVLDVCSSIVGSGIKPTNTRKHLCAYTHVHVVRSLSSCVWIHVCWIFIYMYILPTDFLCTLYIIHVLLVGFIPTNPQCLSIHQYIALRVAVFL